MQAGNANQNASYQLPQDRGQLHPHHQLRQQPGRHEDHQKLAHRNKGFSNFGLVTADFKQKRRQNHGKVGAR